MHRQIAFAPPAERHPFRERILRARVARVAREEDTDLKLFALSFTAFFICIYTFIF